MVRVEVKEDRIYGHFSGHYFPQDTLTVRRKSKAEGDGAYIAIEDGNEKKTFSVALSKEDRIELIRLLGGTC